MKQNKNNPKHPDEYNKILWKYDNELVVFLTTDLDPFMADYLKHMNIYPTGYSALRINAARFEQTQLEIFLRFHPHCNDTCFVGDISLYEIEINVALNEIEDLMFVSNESDNNERDAKVVDLIQAIKMRRDFLAAIRS